MTKIYSDEIISTAKQRYMAGEKYAAIANSMGFKRSGLRNAIEQSLTQEERAARRNRKPKKEIPQKASIGAEIYNAAIKANIRGRSIMRHLQVGDKLGITRPEWKHKKWLTGTITQKVDERMVCLTVGVPGCSTRVISISVNDIICNVYEIVRITNDIESEAV